MNATSTHDTKRSEDARMRLAALSEFARDWRRELRSWARLNERVKAEVDGVAHPGAQAEHYLYQILVACWDGEGSSAYTDRIAQHMQKAGREAKTWTSWVQPNEEAEAAVDRFVRSILHPRRGSRFRARLDAFVKRIQPAAESNSLALLALKCLAPGVPDFYQGAERELLTLTDPDNRGIIDFGCMDAALERPGPKTDLACQLIQLRRQHPALFERGAYQPLTVEGELANHLFGFVREHEGSRVAVLIRRRVGRGLETGALVAGATSTSVELPAGSWSNLADGSPVTGAEALESLTRQPVVVLVS